MKIFVHAIPRSSKNEIVGTMANGSLKVKLTAAPVDGKANEALVELLSEEYGVAKSRIRIVKGESGRRKVVEISNSPNS